MDCACGMMVQTKVSGKICRSCLAESFTGKFAVVLPPRRGRKSGREVRTAARLRAKREVAQEGGDPDVTQVVRTAGAVRRDF